MKAEGWRRDTTAKVLKKRRSPRRRGRTGTSVRTEVLRRYNFQPGHDDVRVALLSKRVFPRGGDVRELANVRKRPVRPRRRAHRSQAVREVRRAHVRDVLKVGDGAEGDCPYEATNVGVEFKGVRSGVERRRARCVGIESEGPWAERCRRREKSLRIGVHHADGVVWGPV